MHKICVLFLSLLLITLQSFYFPFVGSGLTYLGLVFLTFIFIKGSLHLDKADLLLSLFLILCVVLSHLSFHFIDYDSIDFKSTLALCSMIVLFPVVTSVLRDCDIEVVQTVLKWVILFHVSIFLLQVIYWAFTKEYLDVLKYLTGMKSGSYSKKGIVILGEQVVRFSGLFNEPGSFSVVVMALTLPYYSLIKKLDKTIMSSIFCCLMSMSAFGIILVALLVFVDLLSKKNLSLRTIVVLLLPLSIFIITGGLSKFILRFSDSSDFSGSDFRENMLRHYFSGGHYFDGIRHLDMPDYFVPNDIGVWFTIVLSYGFLGYLMIGILLVYIFFKTKSLIPILIFSIILLTKLKYTYPLIWLALALLVLDKRIDSKAKLPKAI